MKFLSTWLRNRRRRARRFHLVFLNEVPEHMAQELNLAQLAAFGIEDPQ